VLVALGRLSGKAALGFNWCGFPAKAVLGTINEKRAEKLDFPFVSLSDCAGRNRAWIRWIIKKITVHSVAPFKKQLNEPLFISSRSEL